MQITSVSKSSGETVTLKMEGMPLGAKVWNTTILVGTEVIGRPEEMSFQTQTIKVNLASARADGRIKVVIQTESGEELNAEYDSEYKIKDPEGPKESARPMITEAKPASAKVGDSVTLSGRNLTLVGKLRIGEKAAAFQTFRDAEKSIQFNVPAGTPIGVKHVIWFTNKNGSAAFVRSTATLTVTTKKGPEGKA
jgi:hypothetical protein